MRIQRYINRGTQGVQPAADENFDNLEGTKLDFPRCKARRRRKNNILEGTKVDFPRCRAHLEIQKHIFRDRAEGAPFFLEFLRVQNRIYEW